MLATLLQAFLATKKNVSLILLIYINDNRKITINNMVIAPIVNTGKDLHLLQENNDNTWTVAEQIVLKSSLYSCNINFRHINVLYELSTKHKLP